MEVEGRITDIPKRKEFFTYTNINDKKEK